MNDNWKSGIDGGEWVYCEMCRVSTPLNERGICATCGSTLAEKCGPECRCVACLRQQDRFWTAFDTAVRHRMAGSWLLDMKKQGHFPAHLIAAAAKKIAEAA